MTPVIAFLDDVSVLEELRVAPREVACIFDHLLEVSLDPELLRDCVSEQTLVPLGSEHWQYETEFHVSYPSYIAFFLGLFSTFLPIKYYSIDSETELLGRLMVGHYVPHTPF